MSVGESSEPALSRARPVRPAPTPLARQRSDTPALARVMAMLAAVVLGAVLPILMVVANKSAPAALAAAALLANGAALLGGRRRDLGARYRALVASPETAVVAAVVVLFVASFAWTIDAGLTRRGLVEGLPELVFALAAAAAWPLVADRRDARWIMVGIVGAGLLILFEHLAGMPLHALARVRGEAWDMKRSAVPPVVLLWPAIVLCRAEKKLWMVGVLAVAVAVGVAAAHSGAPAAAAGCGAVLFAIAIVAPRLGLGLLAAGLALLLLTAPWTGSILSHDLPADTTVTLQEEHAEHRLVIWNAFEKRGFDHPLLGHGFDASYKVALSPRPGGAPPPPDSARIVDFHPHDIVLQFWVELGVLGLATAAAVCCFLLAQLVPRRGVPLAARLGLFVTIVGIGLVGLSAWQPWWLASIAAALLWFDFADRHTTA